MFEGWVIALTTCCRCLYRNFKIKNNNNNNNNNIFTFKLYIFIIKKKYLLYIFLNAQLIKFYL
ncbi:MAG: hypothetical protein N7Q72_07270, partial [Spiroplasma sp. Tabriz.8]|nr:hypothetical protein [Spiroplasma sp. Tabriz.8]